MDIFHITWVIFLCEKICDFNRLLVTQNLFEFLKFIYFNWRLITLQYCGGFCHTLAWISHECTCGSLSWSPLHLCFPRTPALSAVPQTSNLHWSSVLHIVIYLFQCYSFILSHPRLLQHSPKVCSLHLCLFCCLTYRIITTAFLNSIYMC